MLGFLTTTPFCPCGVVITQENDSVHSDILLSNMAMEQTVDAVCEIPVVLNITLYTF